MTCVDVGPSGFAVNGGRPWWGAFAAEDDPLLATARAFVGARNPRVARLDRPTLAALVAARLALCDGGAPHLLVLCVEGGVEAADRAYWETALRRGGLDASPALFTATLASAVAGEIATTFGLRGPSFVFVGVGDGDPCPDGVAALAGVKRPRRLDVRLSGWEDGAHGVARAAAFTAETGARRSSTASVVQTR